MVDSIAYLDRPAWARLLQRFLYIACYSLTGGAGYVGVAFLGFPAREAGYMMIGASAVGLVGVVTRLYHLELIALWPILAGVIIFVFWIAGYGSMPGVILVLSSAPLLAARLLSLNLLANHARARAEAEG